MNRVLNRKAIPLWLACCLLLAILAPSASAAEPPASEQHYVILGDSLAIGYEPGVKIDSVPYGYADRVYEQALLHGRATAKNYGLGGLTSTGLKNLLQATADGKKIKGSDLQPSLADPRADRIGGNTAQIKADIASATFITITIGGNDIGTDIVEKLGDMDDAALAAFAMSWMKTYTDNVTSILQNLFVINKNVRVYIADQYSPVPAVMKALYPKAQTMKDIFSSTLGQIVDSFKQQNFPVTAVPVAEAFVGNEGTYSHIAERDIHPNQSGYKKIAEVFAKSIWGEYRTELTRTEPITVVVAGHTVDTAHLPALLQDSTYVPLREYSEALGAVVDWDEATQTATVGYNGSKVALTLDSNKIVVNGAEKQIDLPAPYSYQSNGEMKTYIPLRLMAEGLGFDVQFIDQSRTAYINR